MKQNGQLFSLDVVISLVAVTAAIGLMIQATELSIYNQNEERAYNEMKMLAETAADIIVASPDTTVGGKMNCVDSTADFLSITAFLQGSGYNYDIGYGGTSIASNGGDPSLDFYEARRTVFIGSCGGSQQQLYVKVRKR